jgi:hypothetical protein
MTASETPQSKPEIPPISKRRQQRIREIQDLFDSGLKVSEIAAIYGISERMVRQDKEDGKAFDRALSKTVDQAELLGREIRSFEQAMRMEWRAYRLATNPFVKVACMRNLIALKEKYIKFLQGAGLLDKVPEQLKITGLPLEDDKIREAAYALLEMVQEKIEKNTEVETF